MLISLTDDIWPRLYGPYGVQDVAGILKTLSHRWDETLASDLFWEMLHHQNDLYPVTFAALPWIWELPNRDPNTLIFLSHVLFCATGPWGTGCDGTGPRGTYRGLSLALRDHLDDHMPAGQRMINSDMAVLAKLERWFTKHAPLISQTCLGAISDADNYRAAQLSTGFVALNGSHRAATLLNYWADGHDEEYIWSETRLTAEDIAVLRLLIVQLNGKNKALHDFLIGVVRMDDPDPSQKCPPEI